MTGSDEYNIWRYMKRRCNNPNIKSYNHYGGRGLQVSKRWDDFSNFYKDMGPRPSKKHSIERRNNNKGYSKFNCYWATHHEQSRNRRNNRYFFFENKKIIMSDLCKKIGLPFTTLKSRIDDLGWTFEKAIQKTKA